MLFLTYTPMDHMSKTCRHIAYGLVAGTVLFTTVFGVLPQSANAKTTKVNGVTYQNTHYSGKFPAPEGIVLQGYFGKDTFKNPTGSGAYRFQIQTGAKRQLACLDKTRTIQGSKGLSWQKGFTAGSGQGAYDAGLPIPYYNDTPRGVTGKAQFFKEGYKLGYSQGYNNSPIMWYYCDEFKQPDFSLYDEDGWKKTTDLEKAPNVAAVYAPELAEFKQNQDKSLLSQTNVYAWSFPSDDSVWAINKTALNKKQGPLHFSRIDMYESDYDAGEAAMGTEELTKAVYNLYKDKFATDSVLRTHCVIGDENIQVKTYGGKEYGLLTYLTDCKPADTVKRILTVHAMAFTKIPSSKTWLSFSFVNNSDVRNTKTNDVDLKKAQMSIPFIEQFLSKVELK